MKLLVAFTLLMSSFICSDTLYAQKVPSTKSLMAAAQKKAGLENKNIMVIFHASWCGWCKKLDASINDENCKNAFNTKYVIVHLTVDESDENKKLENPGADALRVKFHGEKAGLPFFVVLDKNQKLLGDSYIRKPGQSLDEPGENMGCPAAEEEVAAFCELLRNTSDMNDDQIQFIAARFAQNKPSSH